jgi:type I restriction enzyme M protein
MLPNHIKNKVKDLWDKFWSGGISNPLNAIEQITYLLFLKQLDENDQSKISNGKFLGNKYVSIFSGKFLPPGISDKKKAIDKATLRWTHFRHMIPPDKMYSHVQANVFPFIKQLDGESSHFTRHMQNAAFLIPSPRLLTEAVKTIDEIYKLIQKEKRFIDAQGDFYEFLLSELNTSGKNGQFRTPPHIIELMVELVEPQLGQKIGDPACGTAGFLLGAYKFIISEFTSSKYCEPDENGFDRGTMADKLVDKKAKKQLVQDTFYGFDIDPTMIRIGLMNLMMHGITQPKIDYKDTLSKNYNEEGIYQTVLANPPFTGNIDKGDLNPNFSINTTKSELLFVERIYKMLSVGGTAAVVVPQGVLFGSGSAFLAVRKILIDKCELKAVINMPSGVFKPYAGVATAILVFTKGRKTKNVWFYDMKGDGRTLDDKRSEVYKPNGERDFGDLHEIIKQFKNKKKNTNRKEKHFIIPVKEIKLNEFDLSLNKYKEIIHEEEEHTDPRVILAYLNNLETDIFTGIQELNNIL